MIPLRSFLASPLARHPRLLGRKIAKRLGLRAEGIAPLQAPVAAVAYPAHWRGALRQIAPQGLDGRAAPIPFHRVFDRTFDEDLLLRLCREGPAREERGLTGDIKLIWDFSRAHALWPNALHGHFDFNAAFLHRWVKANEDLNGPAWSCAMDVAIRAVNWVYADAVGNGEIAARFGPAEWARWLWIHGEVVWRRLEATSNSTNHYLSNLLGLAVIGSIFPHDATAGRWLAFARAEFPKALGAQTRADGGLNEASLRYHVFVTEMALLTRLAFGEPFPGPAEKRLGQMCQIVADLRDANGDVFAFGDDDSGHVLDLTWTGDIGRGDAVLEVAQAQLGHNFQPAATALHPWSGWWVRRVGDFTLAFEFGGVGTNGHGAHAHNDDFSFGLEWRGQSVVVDPGTYLYTSDPDARNAFRSVRAHNTLSIDGHETRELTRQVFHLPGDDSAFPTRLAGEGPDAPRSFRRPLAPGIIHQRSLQLTSAGLVMTDEITGTGEHRLEWRFHFQPGVEATVHDSKILVKVPGAGMLALQSSGGIPALEESSYSAGYSHRERSTAACLTLTTRLPFSCRWEMLHATPGRA